jgi:uncharacterized protein (TIGR00730 family)
MAERPLTTTGNAELDAAAKEMLDRITKVVVEGSDNDGRLDNRDQLRSLLLTVAAMAQDMANGRSDRLDVKIAASALAEMRSAYLTLGPHRNRMKVTIFGSARTAETDPLYQLTKDVAAKLAAQDWMIVTGAGPGIMAAGLDGAGRDNALGVAIRLPFESSANEFVDPENLVDMRYFFTRKLALLRESQAFIVMPGGFGTLDEAFELLTLVQTGKAEPVPIVFLGLGHGFWTAWRSFLDKVTDEGYISPTDHGLYRITNSVDEAVAEIVHFYSNYHSLRWTGDTLVLRMHRAPNAEQLAAINADFGEYSSTGISLSPPLAAELSEKDHLDLPRLALDFNRRQPGRLRALIDRINEIR